ncbi:MAG: hypothetical protein BLM47_12480 [Candidatus Reconcilbacillus cellulovorans]|uniref:Uncharacterized protein n=1 Tax=Candidatus Reconcilbacillus cellulovorans TaxID=1906605 RepID=A0A2A6DWJ3_9BACL|nr:MAG: hypothetical protein BLM47_12480 [Candidatus Reconcilbacillus cellulovorans]
MLAAWNVQGEHGNQRDRNERVVCFRRSGEDFILTVPGSQLSHKEAAIYRVAGDHDIQIIQQPISRMVLHFNQGTLDTDSINAQVLPLFIEHPLTYRVWNTEILLRSKHDFGAVIPQVCTHEFHISSISFYMYLSYPYCNTNATQMQRTLQCKYGFFIRNFLMKTDEPSTNRNITHVYVFYDFLMYSDLVLTQNKMI